MQELQRVEELKADMEGDDKPPCSHGGGQAGGRKGPLQSAADSLVIAAVSPGLDAQV